MTITQKDIALRLQISPKSVARALKGDDAVSEGLRFRVLQTARDLGYHANTNREARVMAARRHGRLVRHDVIGFRPPHANSRAFPYYVRLFEGIRAGARKNGVELMLLDAPSTPAWSKVDGFIAFSEHAELDADNPLFSMPCVAIGAAIDGVPSVVADDFGGAKQATEYLIGLGHRRIAYLIDCHTHHPQSEARVAGYRAALKKAGLRLEKNWIAPLHIAAAQFLERGRDSMKQLLQNEWSTLGCTALIVQNDRAAMGAMEVLQDAGIRVPHDLSVIGFDDTDECEIIRPQLSSVHVPFEAMGNQAVTLLLQQIEDEKAVVENVVLPVTLRERASCAPLR